MQGYKSYLDNFMVEFDFPTGAQVELSNAFTKMRSDEGLCVEWRKALALYKADKTQGLTEALEISKRISTATGVNVYTAFMVTLILLAGLAKTHYAGLPKDMWKRNFNDLRYKLIECKLVKGVWGTFVPEWYLRFLDGSRFSFGRLQFEIIEFGRAYQKGDLVLTPKSLVVNIHIPRTGERLSAVKVGMAVTEAKVFFQKQYSLERVVFVCHSWLLYPEHKKLLKPDSNLYAFLSRFDVIEAGEYPDYTEVWRLFDCEYTGDVDALPADTSLRRAYIERIKKGERTGWGYGVWGYPEK